jgi:hypothetical protein
LFLNSHLFSKWVKPLSRSLLLILSIRVFILNAFFSHLNLWECFLLPHEWPPHPNILRVILLCQWLTRHSRAIS